MMLIVTLYTRMSEYTQKTVVINSPMSLSFHILYSHFSRSGKAALQRKYNHCSGVARANTIMGGSRLHHLIAPSTPTMGSLDRSHYGRMPLRWWI